MVATAKADDVTGVHSRMATWTVEFGGGVGGSSTFSSNVVPTANLTYNLGSTAKWWNNIYGTAIHAQYADLAENYLADKFYNPGTVLMFGGDQEVTVADADTKAVAGVVSTNPSYIMNAGIDGLPVALRGRVPCKVIGPVAKGDLLVTSDVEGHAKSLNQYQDWVVTFNIDSGNSVFAKSLEDNDNAGPITVEVAVV